MNDQISPFRELQGPSPHGEGGLKSVNGWSVCCLNCPSPHGEGGLKSRFLVIKKRGPSVPPPTGRVD